MSILDNGVSGLLAARRGLTTAGHNISNANTPGFSRQRVDFGPRTPQASGNGFVGKGVEVIGIRRIFDSFITEQVRSSTSGSEQIQAFQELSAQVDNLLADPDGGLSPALQDYFSSLQELSSDPSSLASRQVLLGNAESLAQRFHSMAARLGDLRTETNERLRSVVAEVNAIAQGVADLNQQIVVSQGASNGQPANDLLDQRDELIRQLSERINVRTLLQDDGALNVSVGSGQSLVAGTSVGTLDVVRNDFDPGREEVALTIGSTSVPISDFLTGGELAGILDFRDQILNVTENSIGRVAIGLAVEVNLQHQLGVDLNGLAGADFFQPLDSSAPNILASQQNTGAPPPQFTATVTDIAALTTSDYQLDYDGTDYTFTRLSDNNVTTLTTFPGGAETVDGITLGAVTSGAFASGDSFVIQPTRRAARSFNLAVDNPRTIAAAAPLRTAVAVANLGSGTIGGESVTNTTNLPLSGSGGAITLTFGPNALGAGVPGFAVTNGPGGTLAYNPATESAGKSFTFAGFGGVSFNVGGVPQSGDSFTIGDNSNGVGDNRNALLLAGIQNTNVLTGGNSSLEEGYGQLVTEVGTLTRQAEISVAVQDTLLRQVTERREASSGVNLDEEAANLLRFQQAYQASAQVISTANQLFADLINAVGR